MHLSCCNELLIRFGRHVIAARAMSLFSFASITPHNMEHIMADAEEAEEAEEVEEVKEVKAAAVKEAAK